MSIWFLMFVRNNNTTKMIETKKHEYKIIGQQNFPVDKIKHGDKKHFIDYNHRFVDWFLDGFTDTENIMFSKNGQEITFQKSEIKLSKIEFKAGGMARIDGVECNLLQVSKNDGFDNYEDFYKAFKFYIENDRSCALIIFGKENFNIYTI